MRKTLKISLKPNEKIYVNGAVLKTDRKVSLEFLNDVDFLLEAHVMQPEEAVTPLRQLYFIIQVMLMTPGDAVSAKELFRTSLPLVLGCYPDARVQSALKHVDQLVAEGQVFEALRLLRNFFDLENELVDGVSDPQLERSASTPRPIAIGE
ncbi:flagellar biosynthesis repressor FlbT [Chelativorans sp. ZYF759]|uniref:flagellar biosynthesis repressor FlbT n=1 Tax=Chelativorans sp. ZYF759 TaxID=2692213 RepID=UPI00145F7B8D|nr:flagellar biosynthesis repressor FlbT [Chelativorans sp. ZYF759]NMG40320.1 flagellar biosynthesis repressor FlbT [Chelativorans sp. ZYF759]